MSVENAQPTSILAPHGLRPSEHALSEILPLETHQIEAPSVSQNSSRTKSWVQIQAPLASAPIKRSTFSETPDRRLPILPRVFMPFPRHLEAPDLSYLHSRDALTLPTELLQIELLKAYIDFVHRDMPLLDLEEFLSAVKYGHQSLDGQERIGIERENANSKQISFLLFQAVMFAGVEYVSIKTLREAGYGNREDAQRVFFSRVRVSFLFSCIQNYTNKTL